MPTFIRNGIKFSLLLLLSLPAYAKPIHIVAAENFYGNIAQQLAGPYADVISIMNNPSQDPHLFSATPSVAKSIAQAHIIIYNGIGYDMWMEKLISAHSLPQTRTIVVAQLINKKPGDNPHIWYNPTTMLVYAQTLDALLIEADPTHALYYRDQLQEFTQQYQQLMQHIATLKKNYQDIPIIATEPIFNEMADLIGFKVEGQNFQLSIMNDVPPSPTQTKNFETLLKTHIVKLLIYNKQVSDPVTERMQMIAREADIPTVGVTETQVAKENYFNWMNAQLTDIQNKLKE